MVRRKNSKVKSQKSKIKKARYLYDFVIAITLTTGETKLVDFLPLFHKYVKGDYLKYYAPGNFKKFIVSNGTIYWGRNEDIIFPNDLIFDYNKKNKKEQEEVLYII